MLRAIDLAINGIVTHGPKYGSQVGAVLVDERGGILAESCNNSVYGTRLHAEEIVIDQVFSSQHGPDLRNTTLYVTLEPCNGNPYHERKHCCEQIAEAAIGRVVIGAPKRIYEGGADFLRDYGIEVVFIEHSAMIRLCNLLMSGHSSKDKSISEKTMTKIYDVRSEIRIPGYNYPI